MVGRAATIARGVLLADAANLPSSPSHCAGYEGNRVKSQRERAEEKRSDKLALIRQQVESGSLVIRKMTDDERRRYPPPAEPARRSGKR